MTADKGRVQRVQNVMEASGLPFRPMNDGVEGTYGLFLTNQQIAVLVDDEHISRTSNDRYQNKIILKGDAAVDLFCAFFKMSGYA